MTETLISYKYSAVEMVQKGIHMSPDASKIVKYLNFSLKKNGLKAGLLFGRKTDVTSDGIYFFQEDAAPMQAVTKEQLDHAVKKGADEFDPGVMSVIENFLETNSSFLNRGACYIPLEKCDEVAGFLGVE